MLKHKLKNLILCLNINLYIYIYTLFYKTVHIIYIEIPTCKTLSRHNFSINFYHNYNLYIFING